MPGVVVSGVINGAPAGRGERICYDQVDPNSVAPRLTLRPTVASVPPPSMPALDQQPTRLAPVLALDLGGTHLRTAVVDGEGVLTARQRTRSPIAQGAAAVVDAATRQLQDTRAAHIAEGGQSPVALGISAPGPLDPLSGRLIDPPNLHRSLHGFALGPTLGDALGLPWSLDRDTNVAVLAESEFGAGAGFPDLVYVTVSTGIGGGIITSGRLLTGGARAAGEVGHISVDMDGPPCGCGARGHLERLSSGTGIARSAREALATDVHAPLLREIAAREAPRPIEAVHVDEAAAAGDPVALDIISRAIRAFAAAIVSIANLFAPDRIIVGGGIAIAWGDRLLQPARDAVAAHAFRVQAARVRIVPAALGDDVGLIGALPLVAFRV